jgi:hypothetical protein
MRHLSLVALLGFAACTDNSRGLNDAGVNLRDGSLLRDGGLRDGEVLTGPITVTPSDVTLDLTSGGPPPSQGFSASINGVDISSKVTFTLTDMTLGSLTGNLFTSNTMHGGSTTLTAYYNGMNGTANIHVRVSGTFVTSDCPGCGPLPSPAPPCPSPTPAPSIVYPLDNVLLPPNMENISVQFTPGAAGTSQQFEVDFQNAATNVQLRGKCNVTNGGCTIDVPQAAWDFIAGSNKGGDAVKVSVRASADGSCASASSSVNISFAEEDVAGGIYYWKSTISATGGVGGQIWRKSFGDAVPEEQITDKGAVGGTCFGCHFLSRDGKRMTVNGDDNDSDDEYADVSSALVDLATKTYIGPAIVPWSSGQPAGFQTFNPDHTMYLGSSGDGTGTGPYGMASKGMANGFFLWNGDTAAGMTAVTAGTSTQRPTMPDWSPDGNSVVYVIGDHIGDATHKDDDHVFGGSLWTIAHQGSGKFAAPTVLLQSAGENNYYPGYSPDGAFIVFNRVDKQPGTMPGPNDSFSNPNARVFVLPLGGMGTPTPIDCAALNGTGALSNSWPRWSPFIQMYKGNRLLWVTFSSTRDYGVKVKNSAPGLSQCYPGATIENPSFAPFTNCKQPQMWMAAINLTKAGEFNNPGDPSFPPFWLPFQDPTTHNHTAQWTQKLVGPSPTPQPCIPSGGDCKNTMADCCLGICTSQGVCGIP